MEIVRCCVAWLNVQLVIALMTSSLQGSMDALNMNKYQTTYLCGLVADFHLP
jgi:hypothetical protein